MGGFWHIMVCLMNMARMIAVAGATHPRYFIALHQACSTDFNHLTRITPTGEACFTHRLVRSERIASKVRQRTLLNLGRHFETKPEDWPALCRRIDELLCGQLAMHHDVPPALESQAQRIAAQLLARERAGEREPVRVHETHRPTVRSNRHVGSKLM